MIVSRFGGRLVAVLAIWLGMAMLGQGPRASASFLPFATQIPQSSMGLESGSAGSAPIELQKPDPPLISDAFRDLQAFDCGAERPASGGASAPSTTSSGPTGHVVILIPDLGIVGPTLMTQLRSREALLIPDPILAAIFEPPRAGC